MPDMREHVRPILRRSAADNAIDWMRFRLDTFPRSMPKLKPPDYQELPWIGLHVEHAYRPEATTSRWNAMAPVVEELGCSTAVDVGCNTGWFPFSLAERGVASVGIDGDERLLRIAQYAMRRLPQFDVGFLHLLVSPRTVSLVPHADCTVLLSVWHHFVRDYGLETAGDLLGSLWEGTQKVLFFETGESAEMPASWRLPAMEPDSRGWLESYLSDVCPGSELRHLGWHKTTSPSGMVHQRNLIAVVRAA
jgi:SAM-dependent methyltransferase